MKKLAVIGSINMDMVTAVDQFPRPGETRIGKAFATVPGGKGANQAVALGKLGCDVVMAGRVGRDLFGEQYLRHFAEVGVRVDAVSASDANGTGTAPIEVNGAGENHIIVVPGANADCDGKWLDSTLPCMADRDIFLLQLEIPHATVYEAVSKLKSMGKTVLLDPAPAVAVPGEILRMVDYITPNETELAILTPGCPEDAPPEQRIEALLQMGVGCVIHKRGADGAYIADGYGVTHVPGFRVEAVDTTAAGDTFNAGFAAGLAEDRTLFDAVLMGNAAGALSVTAFGAQGGMPTRAAVDKLLAGK